MDYDLIIIGAGPGGYTAAILAAGEGLNTIVIEEKEIGGVCLNVGCIPTKAFIKISEDIKSVKNGKINGLSCENIKIDRIQINEKLVNASEVNKKGIDYLFKKNNIDVINGTASFIDKNTVSVNGIKYSSKNIIIAAGSRNKDFKNTVNKTDKVISSTEALYLDKIPESITIIGGGAIGVEFAFVYNNLGTDVTLLEYLPNIIPNMDEECGRTLERSFKKSGIKIITEAEVTKIDGKNCEVTYNRKEKEEIIKSDYILVAMGRTPNSDIIGIEKTGIEMIKGFIKVNDAMGTNVPCIYAIGDVVSGIPMLAHTAYEEASICIDKITGKQSSPLDNNLIPFCVYTEPQVACFGISEKEAKQNNINHKILKSFYKSCGKAIAIGKDEGFVKIIIDPDSNLILGASITGIDATELIHELLICAKNKIPISAIKNTIHAHPTVSELIRDTVKQNFGGVTH